MSDQLWAKDLPLDTLVHRFTVGEDPQTDLALLPYDCAGSAAHARMLAWVGLIPVEDAVVLVRELHSLQGETRALRLPILPSQEDGHTALEQALTERVGEPGKKIHLARSRNDQVATAMRLWMRDATFQITERVSRLADAFLAFGKAHEQTPLPGYTHLRRAMPSTFGQWAASFAEGLGEEMEALAAIQVRIGRNPLGGAAGFGVPLEIDRELTTKLLGFFRTQVSPIDVQSSRGRHEAAFVHELASIALVLERFLWDAMLYATEEFGFLKLPDAFTTGSSIMPQKRNPDVLELGRARCREIRGDAATLDHLAGGLPSSYHRDFQLLKKPTIGAANKLIELLDVLIHLLPAIEVDADKARAACSDELYATQSAYDLVVDKGKPFRDAYKEIGKQVVSGEFERPTTEPRAHLGSPENVGFAEIEAQLEFARSAYQIQRDVVLKAETELWDLSTIQRKP